MTKDSTAHTIMLNRARAHERNHQVDEARALYEQILRESPGHKKAKRALASLNAAATRAAPALTEADFNRVLTLARTNLGKAEAEAARLCRLHPGQPALENLHGVILVQIGTYPEAVGAFDRALKLEPAFVDAMSNLASALSALNRNEEAGKWYEKLLAANAKDPDLFYNYGNTLLNLDRNYDAINAFKNALNLRPLFPGAYNNMGKALDLLGHADQARTCYENVLEIDPNHDKATRNLAQLHSRAQRYKEAQTLYQRLLARDPSDVDAQLGVAICLINVGDQAGAVGALERVLALAPAAQSPQFLLDALRGESRDTMPAEYTQRLFDDYADRFEQDLVVNLEYKGPAELLALLDEAVAQPRQYAEALDVGCGTGLAAETFRSRITRLTGIDISPVMVEKAAEKGLYDTLLTGDAVELFSNTTDTFDLILCCDTLPYMGDLAPLFAAIADHSSSGSHFLCSTELGEDGGYKLQTSARFAHGPEYVIECAATAGFDLLAQKAIPLRKDTVGWTRGGIYCFVRRS